MCSANLTSIALSTDAPLCTWFPQLAQKIPPYRVMSEADDVSLLLSPKDSDEDGDDFGTPEGEFACRLSAASAPDDDCVYGWVVRARVHPCVRVCAPICGGQGTTRGVRVTCA